MCYTNKRDDDDDDDFDILNILFHIWCPKAKAINVFVHGNNICLFTNIEWNKRKMQNIVEIVVNNSQSVSTCL